MARKGCEDTKILSVGEIIWDIYPDKKSLGGAPLNFTINALRCGLDTYLFSAVGEDALGNEACKILEELSVKNKYIQRNTNPTGYCSVGLDEKGVPQFEIGKNCAYDNIIINENIRRELKDEHFEAVYFGTLIQRSENSSEVLRDIVHTLNPREIFCDINLRKGCYTRKSTEYCLNSATVLKMSDSEFIEVSNIKLPESGISKKDLYENLKKMSTMYPNIKVILVTCGAEGSYGFDCVTGRLIFTEAVKVKIISTVGAGDCYGAAFFSAYTSGGDIHNSMKYASEKSGMVVSRLEAYL